MSEFAALGLNVSASVRMPIIYPGDDEPLKDEEGKEAYLELLSEDSAEGRAFERRLSRDVVRKLRRGGRKAVDDEDPLEFQVDKLCTLITGWYLVAPGGKRIDVPFSVDKARALFSDPSLTWLRKQALFFVADAANFTKASSMS